LREEEKQGGGGLSKGEKAMMWGDKKRERLNLRILTIVDTGKQRETINPKEGRGGGGQ